MINLPGARAILDPADFTGLESAVKGEGSVPCSSRQGAACQVSVAGEQPGVICRCPECTSEKFLSCT